jgi:predicted RNA-binding protein with RPS1 domain
MGSIEGLVHSSELTGAGAIGEGDRMDVKVLGVDERGRLKLTRGDGGR